MTQFDIHNKIEEFRNILISNEKNDEEDKAKYELIELFNHKAFTIDHCLTCLYIFREHPFIFDYLCDEVLYRYEHKDIEFYLPQLCSMLCRIDIDRFHSLTKFILDICKRSIHFAFKMRLLLKTFVTKDDDRSHIDNLVHICIKATISCKRPQLIEKYENDEDQSISQQDEDYENQKTKRYRYYRSLKSFLDSLISLESKLLKESDEVRPKILREELKECNSKILASAKEEGDWRPGLYLPISSMNDVHYTIVRIPEHEALILKSKRHAPVLLYLETIESKGSDSKKCGDFGIEDLEGYYSQVISRSINKTNNKRNEKLKVKKTFDQSVKDDISLKMKQSVSLNIPPQKLSSSLNDRPSSSPSLNDINLSPLISSSSLSDHHTSLHQSANKIKPFQRELWSTKVDRIRKHSPYGNEEGWSLKSIIVKYGEDCLQEQIAMQLTQQFQNIFKEENLPLYLYAYKIFVLDENTCLVEPICDTLSIHQLKKFNDGMSLKDYYQKKYGGEDSETFIRARRNFVESLAGYSIVCYLLQLKDRNNANILIDDEGHIIHIDWGFVLWNTPGSIGFEIAPFKLTQDYIDLLGGTQSCIYQEFKDLFIKGFLAARNHYKKILDLVEIMLMGALKERVPFIEGKNQVVDNIKSRLFLDLKIEDTIKKAEDLVNVSNQHWSTIKYDQYQYYTNGTLY